MKKIYIQIIFVSIIAMFTVSCRHNKEKVGDILFPEISLDTTVDYNTELSSIFDDTRIIHLETADECLIGGRSNKVIKSGGNFYIMSMNEVLMFDNYGKFQGKLSRVGNGPEEYSELQDFDIVPKHNEMWVSSDKTIIRYKIPSMEFCGKISLTFFINKFKYLGDDKFIAKTPNDKVFNLCSIDGTVLESYLDKDLANSAQSAVQFVKIGDLVASQLYNSNSAVCYDVETGAFSIKDIISPENDKVVTTEINKRYYDQYGYFDFDTEVMKEYVGIIGFRKINGQGIMSVCHPGPELAVIINNGHDVKQFVVRPQDRCRIIDDICGGQDPSFLMTFAGCESDDSFLFTVPNEDPDLNPSLLEVKKFK